MRICHSNQEIHSRYQWKHEHWELLFIEHEYVRGLVFKKKVCIFILAWDDKEHEYYYFKKRPDIHIFSSVQDILTVCSTKGKAVSASDAAKLLNLEEAELK